MNNFYKHFKFGIEIEMEVPSDRARAMDNIEGQTSTETLLKFVHDGSLHQTKPDTILTELISKRPIKTMLEQQKFFSQLKETLPEFDSSTGEKIFSYYNTTASTHFHWSFQELPDSMLWIFDCIEFEKFFIRKYLTTFKSEKFLQRIGNRFCATPYIKNDSKTELKATKVIQDLNKISIRDYADEENKADGRYRWLNMKSVLEGTGAEIRLFPFLQTYAGVEKTTEFMQNTLLEYYLLPSTQQKLKLIEIYEAHIKTNQLKVHKLNDLKKMVYDLLSGREHPSGEVRMLFAKWVMKQPSLITKQEIAY